MEILALPLVAAGVTKAVDLVRNLVGRFISDETDLRWVWNALAFGFGLLASFTFNVELVTIPEGLLRFEVGGDAIRVLTGLAIGGLSSGWHELFDLWSSRAKK